jgi:heat shock protein HslJ
MPASVIPARLYALVTLALLAAACNGGVGLGPTMDGLAGATWHLQAFETAGGPVVSALDGRTYTVRFMADGVLAVQADCNACGGSWQVGKAGAVSIGAISCTRMFCGVESLDLRFVTELQSAERFELKGATLRIYGPGRRSSLVFLSR